MRDKTLFEHKPVPEGPKPFLQPVPCNNCGSRQHISGSCFEAEFRVKKMLEAENGTLSQQQKWGRRPLR